METNQELKKLTAVELEQIQGAEQVFTVESGAEDGSGNKAESKAGND